MRLCGGPPETQEHLPARFLLDDPLPQNLHAVRACWVCNNGFSADEEYLGCLIEAALVGSVSESRRLRPKVREALSKQPALAASLDAARAASSEGVSWKPDMPRVERILSKLAQGHAAFELSEPLFRPPDRLDVFPLLQLNEEQRQSFERGPETGPSPPRSAAERCSGSLRGARTWSTAGSSFSQTGINTCFYRRGGSRQDRLERVLGL